ncbi:outer membrane beta-barrel protein [Tamlana sp. 2_MG-2023]|uniref:outer membrane beta-barrel protein n=1 Tax=unclassified Tamlana TaxID=2614803 RepID=UPI0026E3FB74|nr:MULTISPECIES: outer membrane beta-barrel protein [unclassified Tamlana]MDO6759796.1 outer membrane beta-barrel protein [Tamlana sp. 2_MG-2023]MDO6791419.1 outer membrane beta-barrel protein [Tamlana sp. 1_MG-2023]
MAEKKHIDRLFQESFKDFEATPSDAVWGKIEAELNSTDKKRRVIPIWWRYAGAAALLLLFLTVGSFLFNEGEGSANQVVDTNNAIIIENASEVLKKTISDQSEEASAITDSKVNVDSTNNTKAVSEKTKSVNDKTVPSKTAVVAKNSEEKNINTIPSTKKNHSIPNKSTTVAKTAKEDTVENRFSENKNSNSALASSTQEKNKVQNNDPFLIDKEEAKSHISAVSKDNNAIAEVNTNSNKNTLTIEEAMAENKTNIKAEQNQNKWSVSPNVAPVYFNSLGEGSSIDQQFSSNNKTGNVNMSYGISTSYAVNNRIKIRSGINKVNLGYNTNNVVVYESRGAGISALKNVNSSASNISVTSSDMSNNFPQSISATNVSIHQNFDYIEVPLEIQYALSQKRFGVNIIGGFSSFFLSDNELISNAEDGTSTYLGEANNINDTSYSANVGLGLNYKFSKKVDLNLEPMFKYQFNTFDNTSGNFTPFFIGVYTGFSIKF